MSEILVLSAYDLTDEGPGRTVNEDATLIREDLGLFAVADGAGGRGRGDVAANLALRSVENFIGSTVRRSHERPDFDYLGTPEQARRLSAAVHRAHQNILQVVEKDKSREGMASTVIAALLAPRTKQIHIAHVGDSRCYRLRHGRLELLTVDHTIATEILERRPETADEVLEQLPRNSVVCALGMNQSLRVSMRTLDLAIGDRFLLCTDGLTRSVSSSTIWTTMREPYPASVIASELLSHALAARSQDNISILLVDCDEQILDEEMETRRYNEVPLQPPSVPTLETTDAPNSAEFEGPEIFSNNVEAVEQWGGDSDYPTVPLPLSQLSHNGSDFDAALVLTKSETPLEEEDAPSTQASLPPPKELQSSPLQEEHAPYSIEDDDLEIDDDYLETDDDARS